MVLEYREVYKGRSRRTGAVFALKKILMHNEKDGVWLFNDESPSTND